MRPFSKSINSNSRMAQIGKGFLVLFFGISIMGNINAEESSNSFEKLRSKVIVFDHKMDCLEAKEEFILMSSQKDDKCDDLSNGDHLILDETGNSNHVCGGHVCNHSSTKRTWNQKLDDAWHYFTYKVGEAFDNLKFWEEEEVKPLAAMMMDETLPAGTWIIAMDNANQDGSNDRVRQAYGLAVHLLHAGVPLKWIIDPNKTNRTDVDFSANVTRVYPSAEAAQNRDFITGPLAIFPGFETQAASVINSFGNGIRVYELVNTEDNVPVYSNLTHKPRVLIESVNEDIHTDILAAAGLSSGTHYEVGTIVGLNDNSCYTLISVPHNDQINNATRIGARDFVQNGGNIYAQCAAIRGFQNTDPRLFINSGFIDEGAMGNFQYDNPSEPAAQFQGTIADEGGSVENFGFNTAPVGGNRIVHDANNVYKFYVASIDNQITSTGGYVHYMAGHNHDGAIDADRTYLNALLRPAERPMECGLNLGPIAIDDSGNIDCNSDSVTIDVLANDSDPLNNGLLVNIVSSGTYGTAVNNNDGTVTYTANLSALWQEDEIIYEACSGGVCSQAIITIKSSDPNQSNIAGTVYEDINENGSFENGEIGQSGVTINLYEDDGSGSFDAGDIFIESVSTNASGDYSFAISSFPTQPGSAAITSQKVTSAYNGQTFVGYGSCNVAYIENNPSYSYLEFDLASIPSSSTITSASLEITTSGGSGSGLNFEVRKVLESWVEGDGTCWPDGNDSGLTWTTRPNLGANSYASGIINDAQSSDVLYNLDITNLVSEWVNGISNYGLAIVNSGGSGEYSFYSDDAAQVNRPKLIIDYTTPLVMDYWVVLEESTLPNGSNLTTSSNSFIQFTNLGQLDCNNDFGFDIGCANQPSLSLSSNTGSTCGVESVTVSANTFGGSATQVTISHDGNGLLTPLVAASSPFEFTYTPVASDAGNIVTITVTTNNPLGSPCVPAVATYALTVNANPDVPVVNVDCSGGNINADVFVSSPLGAQYQYQLNNGAFQPLPAFLSVAPGTYTVTVVNINTGCEATTAPFEVLCECPDDPTLNLSENSGNICAGGSVTISGNTFGGSATNVSLSHDGNGSLVPIFSATSPFEFTYNSVLSDGGNTVTINVTTNNPIGGLCEPAADQYVLTVFPKPIIGGINLQDPTQCGLCDGTITLVGVDPPSGPYLVTYTKDGIPQTGSYVATAGNITLTGQCEGSYDDFVISQNGCISDPETGPFILGEPELPNGAITGPATACLNESTGLYSVAGLANCNSCQYLWSSPGGLAETPNGANTNFTFASSGIQTVVLEITDQLTNCSSMLEYQVNVYGTPVIIGVSQSTCIGTTRNITVNASVTPPEALEYSLDGGPYQLSSAFFGVPDGQHQVKARIVGTTCTSVLPFTFDVDCTCLTPASASIGGPNVICSSETATFIGNFVNVTGGTWSIFSGGGSLSTPSCASNGCETIFTPAGPGNVIIRLTSDDPDGLGPCIPDITDFNLLVNQTPTINTSEKTDPSMCDSCDGSVRLLGVSPNGTYNVNYTKDGAVQSAIVNVVGGILEIDGLCEGSYADFVITINGCSSAPFAGPITLIDPPVPTGLIAGPNTACLNEQTGIYTVAGLQNCTDCDYAWSSTGGIPTNPTGLQTNFVFSSSGLQSVELRITSGVTGCRTILNYNVDVYGVPEVNSVSQSSCLSDLATVTVNASVDPPAALEYSLDGSLYQSSNIFANVTEGSHEVIVRIAGTNCTSQNPFLFEVECLCINPPSSSITGPSLTCADSPIILTGNLFNASSGTWSIQSGGGSLSTNNCLLNGCSVTYSPNSNLTSNETVDIVLTTEDPDGLGPCLPNTYLHQIEVLAVPKIASLTKFDPTECDLCDGAFTISGLNPGELYQVSYNAPGGPQIGSLVANPNGQITIGGLCEGTYNNIVVSKNGCDAVPAGPLTLVEPSDPPAPLVSNNGPLCTGDLLQLQAIGEPAATYFWTGPDGFISNQQNPQLDNVGLINAGLYCAYQVVAGCPSPIACTNVEINLTPDISNVAFTNPTTCEGSDGTITLSGLSPNSLFTVNYISSIVGFVETSLLSTVLGQLTINNLSEGIYSDITVTSIFGCTSKAVGPVILVDPENPDAPSVSSNSPVCEPDDLILMASGEAGAIFNWTGPNGFVANGPLIIRSNTDPSMSGTYSVTQTVDNCVSTPAITNVVVLTSPVPNMSISAESACVNSWITLNTDIEPETNNIFWYKEGDTNPIATGFGPINVQSEWGVEFYHVLVSNVNSCSTRDTVYFEPLVCADPDINQTLVNVPVGGDVSTNDAAPIGSEFMIVDTDPNGSIVMNLDGTYEYTPNTNFVGTSYYTYKVCAPDGFTLCDVTTLTIEVRPGEVGPENTVIAQDDHNTTPLNTPVTSCILCNDSDPQGDNIVSPVQLPGGDIPAGSNVSFNGNGTVTYTPPTNFVGVVTIPYEVCDDGYPIACDQANLIIDVVPLEIEDNQTYANDDAYVILVDEKLSEDVSLNDNDPQEDNQTFALVPGTVENGTVMLDPDGTFMFTPDPGYTGPATFEYEVCDDGTPVACDVATVYITIHEPYIEADPDINQTLVNVPVGGDVSTNDVAPIGSEFMIVDTDPNGSIVMNGDGTYVYTPNTNFVGTSYYTYKVCAPDGFTLCDVTTLTIEVRPGEVGPENTIIAQDDHNTTPLNTAVTSCILCNDSDPQGDNIGSPVQLAGGDIPAGSVVSFNGNGTVTYTPPTDFVGVVSYNGNGTVTYTQPTDFVGVVTIPYEICDDGYPIACDQANLIIDVVPLEIGYNTTYANDDAYVTLVDEKVSEDVSLNDNDPQGDDVTFTMVPGSAENGTVMLDSDGTFMFTPDPGYTGPATFEYEVCDDGTPEACDVATVYITIHEPYIEADPDINQTLVNVPVGGDVSTNDVAPIGSEFMIVDTDPNGSIVMNLDGTYEYTPNTDFVGTSYYTYKVCAPNGFTLCDATTLTIEVRPELILENTVIAQDDHNTTPLNTPVTSCILCNDSDPQGDNIGSPVQLAGGDIPTGSNVSFNLNGSVTYTPPTNFVGVVTIPYEVCDDGYPIACDQANLIIDVVPLEIEYNTTYANDDAYVGYLDEKLNGDVSLNDNDPQGDNVIFTMVPGSVENGAVMLDPNGTFMFTPDPGYTGPAKFVYEVCDDGTPVACDLATVYISIHKRFGAIDGKVWEDSNGNGTQNASESFEECVLVELYESNGTYIKSVLTDENGCYLIDEISPGNYFVKFADFCSGIDPEWTIKDQGFNDDVDSDVFVTGVSDLIDVLPGDTTEIDAGFFECIPIGELVWYDTNENDLFDDIENGINGLKVTAYRKNTATGMFEEFDYTYSGHKPGSPSDDGYWKLCVSPGEYYIQFGTPLNGLVAAQPDKGPEDVDSDIDDYNGPYTTVIFELESGQEKCDIGAGFYQMATAGDIIWRDDNGNGMRENYEERLSGVIVEAYDDEGDKVAEVVTDADGEYMIEELQQENYFFKVIPPVGMHPTIANIGSEEEDSDIDNSNGPNTTAFFSMESGNHAGHIDIGLRLAGVIPVEFISFWGENRGDFNYLEWATASEIGNSHFEVERRLNDGSFDQVGRVEGNGTTSEKQTYNFEDWVIAESGIYYYRLKQFDFNNNFRYSGIVAIKVIREGDLGEVMVYPNPVVDRFNIDVTTNIESSRVEMRMYDVTGKLVKTETLNESQGIGKVSYQIGISELQKGTYNIKVIMNEYEYHKKLIKLRD